MKIFQICCISFCFFLFSCKKPASVPKETETNSTEEDVPSSDTQEPVPKPTDTAIVISENAEFLDSNSKVIARKPQGTVLKLVPAREKARFLEISGHHLRARIKPTAVRILKKSNRYDADNIQESALQAAVFIYSLEYGLYLKFQNKPIPKEACIAHFQQGYAKDIAKGFADHWCKEDETTLEGTDNFLDGPLVRVRFIQQIDNEKVELCSTHLEEEGVSHSVDSLKKVGKHWKIVGGKARKC